MKIKKRIGVFETNSSSSHSISFNPWVSGRSGDDFQEDKGGVINICGGEFGWGWDSGNGSTMKASYYATEYMDNPDRLDLLKEVVSEYTGKPVEVFPGGYIDHQSCGTLDLPAGDREAVKDFVFNPDVWLYIGNDNSDYPEDYDREELESISNNKCSCRMTLKFEGDGTEKEFIFPSYPTEEIIMSRVGNQDIEINNDWYELESYDLPKKEFWFERSWGGGDKIKALIVSFESNEFGKII